MVERRDASSFLKTASMLAFAVLPLAVACSAVEATSRAAEAQVVTGQPDSGHPAVVTLQIQVAHGYSLCTGTMIAASPSTKLGYVPTAAHCLTSATKVFVAAGSDMSAKRGVLNYSVVDFTLHPQYDQEVSSPYDVAIVRVTGVDATTPTLGWAAADGLVEGASRVTSVGFGQTVRPGTDAGPQPTLKERIDGTVTTLSTSQLAVTYDAEGDICHGDSGGPVIAAVNGKEAVVGVHSFVTGACEGAGYSVRTQIHDAFFRSIIGGDAPAPSCGLCKQTVASGNNVCAEARTKCTDDAQCDGLRACLDGCAAGVANAASCKSACADAWPYGAAAYNTYLVYCACSACDDACSTDTTCAAYPKCGMALPTTTGAANDACSTCGATACCAELSACGQDGYCYHCAKNPDAPGCATNELYQRLNSCRSTTCATQCAPQSVAGNP